MSEFFSNYYLEFSYCSFTSLNVNIEKRAEREREREREYIEGPPHHRGAHEPVMRYVN